MIKIISTHKLIKKLNFSIICWPYINLAGLSLRQVQELRAHLFIDFTLVVEEEFVIVAVGCNHNDRVWIGTECANAMNRRTRWNRELAKRPVTGEIFWQNLWNVFLARRLLLEIKDMNGSMIACDYDRCRLMVEVDAVDLRLVGAATKLGHFLTAGCVEDSH